VTDASAGTSRDAATEHVKEMVVQQPVVGASRSGWAFLLRGPRLALAPSRLFLAFLASSILMGAGTIFDLARGPIPDPGPERGLFETFVTGVLIGAGETARGVMTLDPPRALSGVITGFWGTPAALAQVAPWSSAVLALLLLPILVFFGGAIARSAIVEAARDRSITGPQALAFAFTKRGSLVGAFVAPLVAAGVLAGLLWLFGFALLSLPGLNVVGGLLYGVAALLGLLLAFIVFALALGFPLLVPAIAAEASDSVDAVQRAYAYLIDKPARLLLWAAALLVQGAAALFVVTFLIVTGLNWAADLALIGEPAVAGDLRLFRPIPEREELEGSIAIAAAMIGIWERLALLVAGAFALSFFFCASSLVYLRIRRDCDGQAIDDIWPRETVIEKARRGEIERLPDVTPEEPRHD
jgi:hypothetical protein